MDISSNSDTASVFHITKEGRSECHVIFIGSIVNKTKNKFILLFIALSHQNMLTKVKIIEVGIHELEDRI